MSRGTQTAEAAAPSTRVDVYFSDFFRIPPETLEDYGALDISLVNDLPLFIDPFLLFNSDNAQYRVLHAEIIRYMRFLKRVSRDGAIAQPLIESWFTFREVKQNWLGYSRRGNGGHGLGSTFADALQRNLHTVFRKFGEETITQSSHLEKLCLIRDGVGRDNISDLTTNLIKGFLADYTQAFAVDRIDPSLRRLVPVDRAAFNYETRSWVTKRYELPYIGRDYVLLTPKDILTRDETWINRPELLDRFREIADGLPNDVLRTQVNEYLVRVLPTDPNARKEDIREAISTVIDRFPEVLDYYVRDKEEHGSDAVSFSRIRVDEAQRRFVTQARTLIEKFLAPLGFYRTPGNTYDDARERILFLKDVIENKGGHRYLYVDDKPIRRESDLHILYRLTWFGTPHDVSREVNDGRGPADFKISSGATDKSIVEFKLGSNSQLEKNLANQAEIYEKASDATHPSQKVILYFDDAQRERVIRILEKVGLENNPHIHLIDGRADNKPSGSKA
jgi:hypothetical protein